ncbi:MAG: DUF177 domain-containing protein [Sumerlaeia bacterium]
MKEQQSALRIETQRLKNGPVEFTFEVSATEFGLVDDPEFEFNQNVTGSVRLTSAGAETVLVTAEFQTTAKTICARCAEEIEIPIHANNRFAWFLDPGEAERKLENDPDKLYYNGECIDLIPALREELMIDLPMLPKCSANDNPKCFEESQKGINSWTFANQNTEGAEAEAEQNSWISQLNDVKKKLKKS